MTAGHGHVGPLVHGGHQVGNHLGWVLTVAVYRAEHGAACMGPPADYGRGQSRCPGPAKHPDFGMRSSDLGRCRPGSVRAVVVDHDDLEGGVRASQHLVQGTQQLADVRRFVIGRYDDAEMDGRVGQRADSRGSPVDFFDRRLVWMPGRLVGVI